MLQWIEHACRLAQSAATLAGWMIILCLCLIASMLCALIVAKLPPAIKVGYLKTIQERDASIARAREASQPPSFDAPGKHRDCDAIGTINTLRHGLGLPPLDMDHADVPFRLPHAGPGDLN